MPTLRKPGLALAASARQAFTKGGEVAAEISTPSLSWPASFSMRAREAASTMGTLRPPLASRRPETRNIWPSKSAISPASSARQIFTVSPMLTSGLVASRPAALRSAGAPAPRQRMTRPGYISSSVAAAMAMNTGWTEYGLIAIRAILMRRVAPSASAAMVMGPRRWGWQGIHKVEAPPSSAALAWAGMSVTGARPSMEMPNSAMRESVGVLESGQELAEAATDQRRLGQRRLDRTGIL